MLIIRPRAAGAYDARIDAALDAQYYMLRSPFGEPRFYRRRYTSTLGLDVENLAGPSSLRGPRLDFRSRVRLDTDFGRDAAATDPQSNRYLPGLEQGPLDVMYAYLEGSGYWHGFLGFRVGRQYVMDALGYWGFDGGLLSLRLPGVQLSGYVGTEQRSGLPVLSTSRFGGSGVWRGDRTGLEDNQYPAFLSESALAPAVGVAIETRDVGWLHARLGYRRVENRSRVLVSPFLEPGRPLVFVDQARVSSERLGGSLTLDAGSSFTLSARGAYDLFQRTLADASATLDATLGSNLNAGLEYSYYYPTFDADSIFNYFRRGASSTGLVRVDTRRGAWDLAVSSGARWFMIPDGGAVFPFFEGSVSNAESGTAARAASLFLADAGARCAIPSGSITMDASVELGAESHRVGADVATRRAFAGGRYDSLVILSVHDFRDALREERSATSFSYVLGGGVRPGAMLISRGRLGFEWEHSVNRLVGHRMRLLLTMDFTVLQ
ncbi:MAG TPA: hypothetical protein VFQ61_22790 [Polyangiaceae bacterium]|nr:hypothetical protein [Polyangiaceae bacterium]